MERTRHPRPGRHDRARRSSAARGRGPGARPRAGLGARAHPRRDRARRTSSRRSSAAAGTTLGPRKPSASGAPPSGASSRSTESTGSRFAVDDARGLPPQHFRTEPGCPVLEHGPTRRGPKLLLFRGSLPGTERERPGHMAAILVVDDEPSARLTLALLLRHRGHLVREAEASRRRRASSAPRRSTCRHRPADAGRARPRRPAGREGPLPRRERDPARRPTPAGNRPRRRCGSARSTISRRAGARGALPEDRPRAGRAGLAPAHRIASPRRSRTAGAGASIAISPSSSRTCAARWSSSPPATSTRRGECSTA